MKIAITIQLDESDFDPTAEREFLTIMADNTSTSIEVDKTRMLAFTTVFDVKSLLEVKRYTQDAEGKMVQR